MDSDTPATDDNNEPDVEVETPATDAPAPGTLSNEDAPSPTPADEPATEPVLEPELAPMTALESEPLTDAEPAPAPAPEPAPEVAPEPAPEPEREPELVPTTALESEPLTDAEPVTPAPAFCAECGAPRVEAAKFCAACGHAHAAAPSSILGHDDEPAQPLDRKWVTTAVVAAIALILLIVVLIARRDEPGPSNKNAKAACAEMTRISTEIIEGRSPSFAGQLEKVLKSAQAAAKEDKDYASLAAAVKRLNEDPEISSAKGGKAVETIAEECK